jgi:hypothetical protein
MSDKAIVLDANILIRAVLGKRVREQVIAHSKNVKFFAPDVAYADARKYLPALLKKRGVDSATAMKASSSQYRAASKNPSHTQPLQPRPQHVVGLGGGLRSTMPA